MDQASAEDFSHYFLRQFFFVEKFGSTGHRDPKQKPSEPHQARLPNFVFSAVDALAREVREAECA